MNNLMIYVLPKCVKDSLLCYTLVNREVAEGAPDIATCNTNGYLHEVKNKKISRSLNLKGKGTFIRCSYLLQNDTLVLYYLVLTQCQKLLVVKRNSHCLQIIRTYFEVRDVDVYDFESLGFPQIKIQFYNIYDSLVCHFPVEESTILNEVKEENKQTPLAESLEEKLQVLNKHIDELNEECNLLRKQLQSEDWPSEFGMIIIGPIKFSQPLKQNDEPVLKLCNKWIKVFGMSLVLGMKVQNCSFEVIHDVDVLIKHELVRDYVYRIFEHLDDLRREFFSIPEARGALEPGDEAWVVGAFHLPAFVSESSFSFSCHLTSGNSKECLLRETFRVTVLDIASRSHVFLAEQFAVEDIMAIGTIKSESHLEVRTEDMESGAMELMMTDDLGFRKIQSLSNKMFYCTSSYLNGVFVVLKQVAENPSVWEVIAFTSEDSQIYFLVNALYELLPENTTISAEKKVHV